VLVTISSPLKKTAKQSRAQRTAFLLSTWVLIVRTMSRERNWRGNPEAGRQVMPEFEPCIGVDENTSADLRRVLRRFDAAALWVETFCVSIAKSPN
jgi:hypothetical protein